MDAVFGALSDSTRRGMLARLSRGSASIGELGAPYGMSKPAISKHVRVLEEAGLLRRVRAGRFHRCDLDPKAMRAAVDWLERTRRFWEESLGTLAQYLDETIHDDEATSNKEQEE